MRGNVGLFAPVRDSIDTLVHPSAQQDALTGARHRAFIAGRLGEGTRVTFHLPLNCEHFRRGSGTSVVERLSLRATDAPADIAVKKSA